MMAAARTSEGGLIARLPEVRGRYRENVPLADITWFRVGGPAEVVFRPADAADLLDFLKAKPADVPVTVLGVGSNVLVRDGGLPGVVIRLGGGFAKMEAEGEAVVAGAATLDLNVATFARQHGIAGLEFLAGVPGSVGGGVRMNAGAYGSEFKDVLAWAELATETGEFRRMDAEDLGFAYRRSAVPEDWICLAACFAGRRGDPARIADRIKEIQAERAATQPLKTRTGGSTFKNPPGMKAWELIDKAGCRGLCIGDAQVSEKHCNFLINRGAATANDLERLGEGVRARVKRTSGVELEWEIKVIGVPATSTEGKT